MTQQASYLIFLLSSDSVTFHWQSVIAYSVPFGWPGFDPWSDLLGVFLFITLAGKIVYLMDITRGTFYNGRDGRSGQPQYNIFDGT
jgi:hypothetical protein